MLIEEKMRPDLILLDVILPGQSGFDVLENIRQVPELKTTRTLIMSNLGQEMDVQRGKELGADYIVKAQTSLEDIVAKIKEMASK